MTRAEDAQRRNDEGEGPSDIRHDRCADLGDHAVKAGVVEAGAQHDLHHCDTAHESHGNGQHLFAGCAEHKVHVFFAQILAVGQHCADRYQNERRKAGVIDQREVIIESFNTEDILHMGTRVSSRMIAMIR